MENTSIFLAKKDNRDLFVAVGKLLRCRSELAEEVAVYDPTEFALNPQYIQNKFPMRKFDVLFVDLTATRLVTANRVLRHIAEQSQNYSRIFVFHDLGIANATEILVAENVHAIEFPFELSKVTHYFNKSDHGTQRHWPLDSEVLRKFDESPCNFYLKLSDSKLVRAVKKGTHSCGSQIEYYASKGIHHFWVPCEELESYTHAYLKMHFAGNLSAYALNTNLDEYPISREHIQSFADWIGASAAARETTEKNYKVAVGALRQSSQLQNFYQELKSSKSSQRMTQGYLITLMSTAMSMSGSFQADAKALQALAFAAIMSSLGFTEEEYQRRLNCLLAASLAGDGVNQFLKKQVDVSSSSADQWDLCPVEVSRILENSKSAMGDVGSDHLMDDVSVAFLVAQEFVAVVLGLPGLDWAQQLRLRASSYQNIKVREALGKLIKQYDFEAASAGSESELKAA